MIKLQFLPFIIVLMLCILVIAKKIIEKQNNLKLKDVEYRSQQHLFSPAERSFLGVLDSIIGKDYRIFGKVRLADVIAAKSELHGSERLRAFNRIMRKHLDFVICKRDDCSIVGAVELDDKSHKRPERSERDIFVDKALQSAGVPILHYPVRRFYSKEDMKEKLSDTLEMSFEEALQPVELSEIKIDNDRDIESRISELVAANSGSCPSCKGTLEKRKITKGAHVGKLILSCTNYPKCRYISPFRENENAIGEELYNDKRFKL